MSAQGNSTRAIVAALAGNVIIAILKFVAAFITGSASTLAEAVHSVADCGNQILLIVGMRLSDHGPTEKHPFGRAVERYFWPFVVSILLFSVGGLFAVYEGVHKLIEAFGHGGGAHDPNAASVLWNYGVLGTSFVLESFSCAVALKEFNHSRGDQGFFPALLGAKDPTIPVVLLEDFAALFGLGIALLGIGLSQLTGWVGFDALGSLFIGILLVVVAVFLARKTHSLLLGESASDDDRARIQSITESVEGVAAVTQILAVHRGPEDVLVALKVSFVRGLPIEAVEKLVDEIETRVRAELPKMQQIFIEPDSNYDAGKDGRPIGLLMPHKRPNA